MRPALARLRRRIRRSRSAPIRRSAPAASPTRSSCAARIAAPSTQPRARCAISSPRSRPSAFPSDRFFARKVRMASPQQKAFPVSWDQFHRDARALAWRLAGEGPFEAIVCITRGGLVPAAIVARELGVRVIETVCVASYHEYDSQGALQVLKDVAPAVLGVGDGS